MVCFEEECQKILKEKVSLLKDTFIEIEIQTSPFFNKENLEKILNKKGNINKYGKYKYFIFGKDDICS